MNKFTLHSAVLISSILATHASAELTFDANIELDTTITDTAQTDTNYDQSGRVQLNASGIHRMNDYFVSAKGTVNLGIDSKTGVDDAYLMFGNNKWDVQLGRFEAVNLFPLGKDTLIVHAGGVSVYEANMVRGRAGDDGGQIAVHFNASDNLKFEVATIFGDDDTAGDNATAISGIRPSVIWSTEGLSISAGYETVNYDLTAGGDVDKSGFGIAANFDLGSANINIAAARMEDGNTKQEVTSLATNLTYGNFGAGVILSEEDNATGVNPEVITTYAAYTQPLLNIDNASVTFAASYSTADNVSDDEALAARVRFNYTF